jgi:C1A family cysteine protease
MIKKNTTKNLKPKNLSGWVPDIPDQRDIMYGAVTKVKSKLPKSVDLRKFCSPIENQSMLGSCTANALAGALEFLEIKDNVLFEDLSRLFIYYNERVIENSVNSDSGAMLRDGIKTLKNQGVCSELLWPYVTSKFAQKPGPACYKDALNHQIESYQRLQTINEMRSCLASGFPFIFGFTAYESIMSVRVIQTGKLNMPKKNEKVMGGHAVMAVGYNDSKKRFLVRNSWSESWGMKGYFTMPYNYLADRNLSDDFWTIQRVENI